MREVEQLGKGQTEVPKDWNTGNIYLTPKTITALEGVLGTIETAVNSLYNNLDDSMSQNLTFVAITLTLVCPANSACSTMLKLGLGTRLVFTESLIARFYTSIFITETALKILVGSVRGFRGFMGITSCGDGNERYLGQYFGSGDKDDFNKRAYD